MKDFFNHVKSVVVADFRSSFVPFFVVGRAIRSAFRFIKGKVRKAIK
jgi:hypothetical protein